MTEQPEDWDAIHAAMAADKGDDWKACDLIEAELGAEGTETAIGRLAHGFVVIVGEWREAMHDRDRFHAERDIYKKLAKKNSSPDAL